MLVFLLWLASLVGGRNLALSIETSSASGSLVPGCGDLECGNSNGTRMTGLAVGITDEVRTITLPSGEIFTLR